MQLNTILVMGATGQLGGAVCKHLLSTTSATILAATRTPTAPSPKATALAASSARIRLVSSDPASLFPAGRNPHGIDSLFYMSADADASAEGAASCLFLDAAAAAGVQYVVYSGVDLSGVPLTGIASFDVKRAVWAHLQTLPLPVPPTFLGPAGFLETLLWPDFPAYQVALPPAYVHKYVATDDIGRVAARCLADPGRYAGEMIMLAGDAVTPAQLAQAWEKVLGQPVPPHSAEMPAFATHIFTQLTAHPFEADVAACNEQFGPMVDLETFLRTVVKPALAGK